jgi:hypothetical protein
VGSTKVAGVSDTNDLLLSEIADRWAVVAGRPADLLMSVILKAIASGEMHRVHRRPGRTAVFYRKRNSQRPLLVDDVVARGVEANDLKAEIIAVWRVRRADFARWYSGLSTNDLRPRIEIGEFWPDGLARGLIDQPLHEGPTPFRQTGKFDPKSTPSAGKQKMPKLSRSVEKQKFKEWREMRGEDIPTRAEDFSYMKKLGVSRDRVIDLRRDYPSLPRGKPKAK